MKRIKIYIAAFILATAAVTSIPFQEVYAEGEAPVSCDQQFYSANDILFYNPCATSCGASQGTGTATISSLKGANNGEKIFNFWIDSGLSSQQAAGITGSMKHEGGFSPFRQEMSQTWPAGGWGIAQFTHDPGQRGSAKEYVRNAIGADIFDQYYKNDYGGPVFETDGFIPKGVPVEVNDKFLLQQLNYLLQYIKGFSPSSISARVNGIKADFGQTVPDGVTLYDYLNSLVQAPDAAVAWTYLYEYPGDIKNTANVRATSATEIMSLYSTGISTSCGGGLAAGGMTLEEAKKWIEDTYKKNPEESRKFLGGAGQDCPGGPLANCVSFSAWFINKYTSLKGFGDDRTDGPGNGGDVVGNIVARNPEVQSGHSPRPYAIFSTWTTGAEFGHTGVVLGVDTERGKVIIGEAACSDSKGMEWITAREKDLSSWDSDDYIYAYIDGYLKGDVQ